MLRTNSRQVKDKVKEWINNNFDASGYDREDLNNSNIDQKIAFIARTCWEELGHEVKKNRTSFQNMFENWCQGLPSVLDTASYYCHVSAVDLVGDILEQTQTERAKYSECEAEKLMTYLIYKEVANDLFRIAY